MAVTINGTSGITTPGVVNSGTETIASTLAVTGAITGSGLSTTLYPLVQSTNQTTTSGGNIDFTAIPSWVKRITIMFNGVSMSNTNNVQVQLGTGSTTYTTSGYANNFSILGASSVTTSSATSGFVFMQLSSIAGVYSGQVVISNVTGNTWVESGLVGETSGSRIVSSVGSIALGAALTAVRITSVSADTFDAGSINILYE